MRVNLTYRKFGWARRLSLLLSVISVVCLWFAHPISWLGWIALVTGQISVTMLYLNAQVMADHWRRQLEMEITKSIETALRDANPDLLTIDRRQKKASEILEDAAREMRGG